MQKKIRAFIDKHQLLKPNDRVLVAVSGGLDSVVLAHLLHGMGCTIGLAHVNYKLRGDDAGMDEQLVKDLAADLGVGCHTTIAWAKKPNSGIQEAARKVRYQFFETICSEHGYSVVATAHHADDLVESVVLNLLRGTGIHGMKGIPLKRGNIVRPLLFATRNEILTYQAQHGLSFREDTSNATDDYLRNRIRHHVLPTLNTIEPNAPQKLKASADMLATDAAMIERYAQGMLKTKNDGYVFSLEGLPKEDQPSWLYHAIRPFGFGRQQCVDLLATAAVGKKIETKDYLAQVSRFGIEVFLKETPAFEPLMISGFGEFGVNSVSLAIRPAVELESRNAMATQNRIFLDESTVHFPLRLRGAKAGDRFQPLGLPFAVDVVKYLRDKHWSALARRSALVLEDNTGCIIWVIGVEIADACQVKDHSTKILSLSFDRNEA